MGLVVGEISFEVRKKGEVFLRGAGRLARGGLPLPLSYTVKNFVIAVRV